MEGVRYEVGSVLQVAARVVPGADVVVAALSRAVTWVGRLVEVYASWPDYRPNPVRATCRSAVSSSPPGRGLPRVVEGEILEQYRAEAPDGCVCATRVMLAEQAPGGNSTGSSSAPLVATWVVARRAHRYLTGSATRSPCSTPTELEHPGADFALAIVIGPRTRVIHREHISIAYDHSPRCPLPAACTTPAPRPRAKLRPRRRPRDSLPALGGTRRKAAGPQCTAVHLSVSPGRSAAGGHPGS